MGDFRIYEKESQVVLLALSACRCAGDPSLRLKNGYAQDDAEGIIAGRV